MGFAHIDNLYRNKDILIACKEVWATEKLHGTSAHIHYSHDALNFFSGGAKHETFLKLFNQEDLLARFRNYLGHDIKVHGEAYGPLHKMSETYGKDLHFTAFGVLYDGLWLDIPQADALCQVLGIEFVHYVRVPCEVSHLDAQRDADSVQAIRNGMGPGKMREGIVIYPLHEILDSHGERLFAKHKRLEFMETKTFRPVDPNFKMLYDSAQKAAEEWVTEERLVHVLDHLKAEGVSIDISSAKLIISTMMEDVFREAGEELEHNKKLDKAVATQTVLLLKRFLYLELKEATNAV